MVTDILTASGVQYRRGRFIKPPTGTYAVYMDDTTVDGPDGLPVGAPCIVTHDVTVELYEAYPDDAAEAALEAAILAAGLTWTKQDRYWLQSEQLYQVIYEFTYREKKEGQING